MDRAGYETLAASRIFRDYQVAFHDATGLALRLWPVVGELPGAHSGKSANAFCALVGRSSIGSVHCRNAVARAQRLAHGRSVQLLPCFAGLTDVAVSVVVDNAPVALLLAGQVLLRKPTRRQFDRLAGRLAGRDLDGELLRLELVYFRTPVLSRDQFRGLVRLVRLLAAHLAIVAREQLTAVRKDDPPRVAQAKQFARAHLADRFMVGDVARHVHLSTAHFCRTFKRATGMSFIEYLTRLRIEKAKQLLLDPGLRVTDIAFASGFESIPHFNRVFRRYVRMSPTDYRAARRRSPDFQI